MKAIANVNPELQSTSMGRAPKNWPANVQYIQDPIYHSSVPSNVLALIKVGQPTERGVPVMPSPCDKWTHIENIISNEHPVHGQLGLFASKKIQANTMLMWYIGQVHAEQRDTSDYDLSLMKTKEGINVGVDAQLMGNAARCINDYRGVAERPNAIFKEGRTENGELRMSVWTGSKPVTKGDELLVSYGKGWWTARV